jgi:hypothetical protein
MGQVVPRQLPDVVCTLLLRRERPPQHSPITEVVPAIKGAAYGPQKQGVSTGKEVKA